MTPVGIALAVAVAAAAVWTRAQKRRIDPQREVLDFRTIAQRFYAGSDVTPADVERAYKRIAEATGVPAGVLRPDDRFDRELKPQAGWEYDDPIYIFSDQLARDAASAGVALKLEELTTVDDAVHVLKRIHDAGRV
jgi:hypothetical protein